jgi:molecular chaperone GrpE
MSKKKQESKDKESVENLQRLQAEFDNYKKYAEKERLEFKKYANHELILRLLDVIDSFELALKNKDENEDFKKGVELIYAQLYSLLEKEGVEKIDSIGINLDPEKHDVMLTQEGKEDNKIIEELQKGYMLKDKVLRYSKVKVVKNGGKEK